MCEQGGWVRGVEKGHSSSLDAPCCRECRGSTPLEALLAPACKEGKEGRGRGGVVEVHSLHLNRTAFSLSVLVRCISSRGVWSPHRSLAFLVRFSIPRALVWRLRGRPRVPSAATSPRPMDPPMDPLAALLSERPPQQLSRRAALPHRAARGRRTRLRRAGEPRTWQLVDLPEEIQQVIFGRLCNALDPRSAVAYSSASRGLREPMQRVGEGAGKSPLEQLKEENAAAAALGLKMGVQSCKALREAKEIEWRGKGLSATDLATLGKLTPVLPALEKLTSRRSASAGPDGGQLVEGLGVGALPAVTCFRSATCAWRRRRLGVRGRPGPRRPAAAQAPRSVQRRHRRRGSGGPRAGLAAAACAGDAWARWQPVRRRGPRRPRGAAAGRCAAAAG